MAIHASGVGGTQVGWNGSDGGVDTTFRRHKVLFVLHNFPPRNNGGVELYTYHMARSLLEQGVDVSVIYPVVGQSAGVPTAEIAPVSYDAIPVFEMRVKAPSFELDTQLSFPVVSNTFARFLEREKFDVVHFHHFLNWPVEIVRIAKQRSTRTVITLHDFWPLCYRLHMYVKEARVTCSGPESAEKCAQCVMPQGMPSEAYHSALVSFFGRRAAVMKQAVEMADEVFTPSSFMQNKYAEFGIPVDRIAVEPLGVNIVQGAKQPLHQPVTFGYMGTIYPLKGVYLLVDVFKKLSGQANLVIYGGGAEEDITSLRAQIAEQGNISYGGPYQPQHLKDILGTMDVLVVPSANESYCFTAREALSGGIPVIAARVGGLADAVVEGVNGWLIDPTYDSLLSRMQAIVDQPACLLKLDVLKCNSFPSIAEDAANWIRYYARAAQSRSAVSKVGAFVSIIICSIDDRKFDKVRRNYEDLLQGVTFEIIRIPDAKSLCEGYNRGIDMSSGDVLIFSHDDIEFIVPDFWDRLQRHLEAFDMVGVAGTSLLAGPTWGQAGVPFLHGLVIHKVEGNKLRINCYDTTGGNVCAPNGQAVDGVFFALHRRVVEQVRFDQDTFDGFHLYDLDFSYRAYQAGFNIGICRDLTLIHDSMGGYDAAWERYAYLFATKHAQGIPMLRSKPFVLAHVDVDTNDQALVWVRALNGEVDAKRELAPHMSMSTMALPDAYRQYWIWEDKVAISEVDAEIWAQRIAMSWRSKPLIHLVTWFLPGEEDALADTLDSLGGQLYGDWRFSVVAPVPAQDPLWTQFPQLHWQTCSVDDWLANINQVVMEAQSDWVWLLPPGVKLEPHALLCFADYVNRRPEWRLAYWDDDRIGPDGSHFDPQFKPDFNPDLLRSIPYMGESLLVRHDLLMELGGYSNFPGWENYHLAVLASLILPDSQIGHIARVLAHYPYKRPLWPQEQMIGRHALQAALSANNIPATVEKGLGRGTFLVDYEYPGTPMVSILIPTKDKIEYLRPCISSVLEKTDYPNFEILIADNQSCEPETLAWFSEVGSKSKGRVRVLPYDADFNFSAICNFLVQHATGEYLLLLNNDTFVVQRTWLDRMVAVAKRPDVGVVGCRLLYPESGKIQHAGIVLGFNDVAGHVFEGVGNFKYSGYMQRALCQQNYSAVTAACMLVRRKVYEEVGGMDVEDLSVLYNDVDLCLKVGKQGYRIVYTPHATVMHYAGGTLRDVRTMQDAHKVGVALERKEKERRVFWNRWREVCKQDPAWNVNLSLRGAEGQAEYVLAPGWDSNFHDRPRVLGVPLSGGAGEYRVISPLRALRTAGRMQVAWSTSDKLFHTRVIKEYELARLAPDSILMHAPLDDEQLASLQSFAQYVPEVMRIAAFDDLLTAVPDKNSFKRFGFRDVERRLREVIGLVDRCIVSTKPLQEWLIGFGANDVLLVPNCLEKAKWGDVKSVRRTGNKPRVGWAGAQQHAGDLEIIAEVVKATANEVEWVFFGMCPDELRPYVHEFHEFVLSFDAYPNKLASLNLDLAVAPLEIHPFNEAKSNLRLLEYGIMGWPVVCTDIFPYQGAPVKRVPNDTSAWITAIRDRVNDLDAAAQEGDRLREWVLKNFMIEDHLMEWQRALLSSHSIR